MPVFGACKCGNLEKYSQENIQNSVAENNILSSRIAYITKSISV
jgi:hypothetical protein